MLYFIYRLYGSNQYNNSKYHYIGSTPLPRKRIRQHNGVIVGGAKCTSSKLNILTINKNTTLKWNYQWILMTFLNNKNALTLEWHLKYPFNVINNNLIKKKTQFNVLLNNETFKYRCYHLSNDINIMLKQIDVTIQYVFNKNNIIGKDKQIIIYFDNIYKASISYQSINFTILFLETLTNNIMAGIMDPHKIILDNILS